jgi:outer membrane protein
VNYTGSGQAGTQIKYGGDAFNPTIVSQTTRGFGGALGDSFNNSYPAWTYGVQVSYPIGKSDTEASHTRAQLQKKQAELQLRDLELQVATQVRDAARQVETNFKRVQASRASLQAQEKRLEAEQKRFDVGTSDTFKLFQVQRDVAAARVSELQSMLAYSQALINFDAVQRIR